MLLLGSAVTAPRTLRAQQMTMPVIGYLSTGSPAPNAPSVAAFRQGLSETGYVEGQNVAIVYRVGRRAAMTGCPHWPPISSAARSM